MFIVPREKSAQVYITLQSPKKVQRIKGHGRRWRPIKASTEEIDGLQSTSIKKSDKNGKGPRLCWWIKAVRSAFFSPAITRSLTHITNISKGQRPRKLLLLVMDQLPPTLPGGYYEFLSTSPRYYKLLKQNL